MGHHQGTIGIPSYVPSNPYTCAPQVVSTNHVSKDAFEGFLENMVQQKIAEILEQKIEPISKQLDMVAQTTMPTTSTNRKNSRNLSCYRKERWPDHARVSWNSQEHRVC